MNRYHRQELYEAIGKEGQRKIRNTTVAIVGIGALGSVSSELLCRSGIGKLILIDRDFVDLTNLQRQVLYEESDIGRPKAMAAEEHLKRINSEIKIESHVIDLNFRNIENILKEADIIIDGTDNLETRFLINEYSLKYKKPWIHGSAIQDRGFVVSFSGNCPCFQCIIKEAGTLGTCDTLGVMNSITSLIGSMQASECIKMILGRNKTSLIHVKLMNNKFDIMAIKKNPKCPACNGCYDYLEGRKGH